MHLSPHDCDLLLADQLSADKAAELRAHAQGCEACGARLRDADAARAAFLVANPPAARAHALVDELGGTRRPKRYWTWALGAATTVAAVLLLIQTQGPPAIRLKGESLSCRLVRDGKVLALLGPGDRPPAAAGDALRCTAAPTGAGHHLEVWGADRMAPPQRLFAGDLDGPTEVPPGSAFAVSGQGEMRLYFVWSTRSPDTVAMALQTLPDRPSIDGARSEWIGVVAR